MSFHTPTVFFRSFSAAAALGLAALSAPAGAAVVSITYSPNGLPAATGPVSSIDLTGHVGETTPFTVNSGANAVTVTTQGGAIVQGSLSNQYAAPVTGGTTSNPVYYSAPYISTGGQPNTVSLTFNSAQSYFGLLWGSIGSGDYLGFYDSADHLLSSVSGTQAMMAAAGFNNSNGAQGFGGSQYTLINFLDAQFSKVVIGQSGGPSFEAASFEYAAQNVSAVPEPSSIALAAVALMSCVALRRKS